VAPVANAGVNQSVTRGSTVTLNGAGSSDPDGNPSPLSYSWTQTGGPSVSLSGATTAAPSFTASAEGTLTFRLTVSDGLSNAADDVTVVVNPPGNLAPVANAGNDRAVTVGDVVTLSSAGSSDPDGTIVSYLWAQIGGASITLNGGNTATATFTPPSAGSYAFRLTATDNQGATGTDTVTIIVTNGETPPDDDPPPPDDGEEPDATAWELRVMPNRTTLADLSAVRVEGPAPLAGKARIYGSAGVFVGELELVEDASGASATLGDGWDLEPGLYILVAGGNRCRLVILP
jgi:hypothetical protein